jgi:hypothetical protein
MFQVELPAIQQWRFGPEEASRISQPVLSVFHDEPAWAGFKHMHLGLNGWVGNARRVDAWSVRPPLDPAKELETMGKRPLNGTQMRLAKHRVRCHSVRRACSGKGRDTAQPGGLLP